MFRATVFLGLISLVIGAEDDRIVGGKTAMIKEAPYMVSMQRRDVHICGGTIIDNRTILTAAHCVAKVSNLPMEQISIRYGSTIWSTGGEQIGVKSMIIHPKYDAKTKVYDAALLKLKKPLEFDPVTARPIKMAMKVPGDGKNGLITGWGLKKEKAEMIPSLLQKANVTTYSRAKCSSKEFDYGEDIMESMICAHSDGLDACQGDSGGPLVVGNEIVGIISFGKGCGRIGYPGVYMLVPYIKNWIAKYSESLKKN